MMKCIPIILIAFLLGSKNVSSQTPAAKIPFFSFKTLTKTFFTNKDLEPGKLLFFVFFDSECDHCQHGVNYISTYYNEFKKAAIYLITLDSVQKITAFMNTYAANLKDKKNVTILQDPKYEFMNKFKPKKYPSLFLYSTKGELMMYDDNEQNLDRVSQIINATAK